MAILTAEEMLYEGLRHLGVTPAEWQRRKQKTREEDFASHFGPSPDVVAALWSRLQTTNIKRARINPAKNYVKDFLTALHWLKIYPTENERRISIKVGKNSGRKWSWFYTQKIAALKDELVLWPDEWDTIYTVTVDGVHFHIQEPTSKSTNFRRVISLTNMEAQGLIMRLASLSLPNKSYGLPVHFQPAEVTLTSFEMKD
jgi:hypothetical protein